MSSKLQPVSSLPEAWEALTSALPAESVRKITVSSPFHGQKGDNGEPQKITAEPRQKDGALFYLLTYYTGNKVRHENLKDSQDLYQKILRLLLDRFRQCDMVLPDETVKIWINRNGTYRILRSKTPNSGENPMMAHNRKKNHIITENAVAGGEPPEWLVALGVMSREGKVLADKQKKFRQVNRFLEMIKDIAETLPENPSIVDFGCGKSYLTFALYDYLLRKGKKPEITGLDLKEDVVRDCRKLAESLGFDGLRFMAGDISRYGHDAEQESVRKPDMIITLHACDTATDYALYYGIRWECRVILSVPCCQHELFPQVQNDLLQPMLKHGILKEKFSALLTDSLRACLLEIAGYKTTVMEFVDMEHTPKNIMIRAVKKGNVHSQTAVREKLAVFRELADSFHVTPKLGELLKDYLS